MSHKFEYHVVEADSLGELARIVEERSARGWMCQGGVAWRPQSSNVHNFYLQAMVRYPAGDPEKS